MLDVLILEDEDYTLRYLERIITEHPMVHNVIGTRFGREAVKIAKDLRLDAAFLDIELDPEDTFNGLEVASYIAELSPRTKLVFLTGHAKYALDSFAVHPYDYVLKPVGRDRLFESLTNLAKEKRPIRNNGHKRLITKSKDGLLFFIPAEIYFFEKQGKKVFIHTKSGIYEASYSLTELERMLPSEFLRTHKAFIVNTTKIKLMKDMGNRSWEIIFHGYDYSALMSRYKYEDHREFFSPSL